MKSMISLLTRFTKTIAIAKTVALLIFLTPIQINATNLNTDGLKLIPGGDDVSIVKVVTGKVTTDKGNPLPGVTIAVKGTSRGLITDAGGNYSIEVDPGETLIFSFIGFRPQEIVVGNQTQINISLVIDVIGLDEVVAIGYGYQKKSDLTGAVVSVSKEDLTMGGSITSAAQTLSGITLHTPDIGTPSAGVLTNCSGTASSLTAGAVSTITGLAPDTAKIIVCDGNFHGHPLKSYDDRISIAANRKLIRRYLTADR